MRAGFTAHIYTLCPCFYHQAHPASTADLHNVQRTASFAGKQDGALNGFQLGNHGPRGEIVAYTRSPLSDGAVCQIAGNLIIFRVDDEHPTKLSDTHHAFIQCQIIGQRKIGDAAVAHECFKANDAPLSQPVKMLEIAWYQATPECEIDER